MGGSLPCCPALIACHRGRLCPLPRHLQAPPMPTTPSPPAGRSSRPSCWAALPPSPALRPTRACPSTRRPPSARALAACTWVRGAGGGHGQFLIFGSLVLALRAGAAARPAAHASMRTPCTGSAPAATCPPAWQLPRWIPACPSWSCVCVPLRHPAGNSVFLANREGSPQVQLLDAVPINQGESGPFLIEEGPVSN